MGLHAFDGAPTHHRAYEEAAAEPAALPQLFGCVERWNMPVSRCKASLDENANFPGVDHYVLTYHVSGSSVRRVDRPEFGNTARKGAVSLQAPGSGGSFRSRGAVDYAHFYFRQSLLCEVGDAIGGDSLPEPRDFFAHDGIRCGADLRANLDRGMDRKEPPPALEMDSRAYLIVAGLLRDLNGWNALPPARREPERVLHRARALIEERIGDPLRLSDLAEAAGLSPFHFARAFRQAFGEPPATYLMRRRTERAVAAIRAGEGKLADIAYRYGFSSQSHMSRHVKRLTGRTPGRLKDTA